jgi:uncharacterized protein with HEPN domain
MVKDNLVYIQHILDSIAHIESFLTELGIQESIFASSRHWQDAFVRKLEIIGEAANQLDKDFIEKYPEIPWRKIISMRHKLVHDYFEIKMPLVWSTATIDIPEVKKLLSKLLESI